MRYFFLENIQTKNVLSISLPTVRRVKAAIINRKIKNYLLLWGMLNTQTKKKTSSSSFKVGYVGSIHFPRSVTDVTRVVTRHERHMADLHRIDCALPNSSWQST